MAFATHSVGGTLGRSLWLFLITAGVILAQVPRGPDSLVLASAQAAHAQALFERCSYREAEQWLRRALDSARRFRSSDAVERDTAGSLVARLEIRLAETDKRRRQLDREAAEISRLVSNGWHEIARRRLTQLGPPACDAQFQQLQERLDGPIPEAPATHHSDRRIAAKIGKAVLYLGLLGGIGYAGYVGYQTYKERAQNPSQSQTPKPRPVVLSPR